MKLTIGFKTREKRVLKLIVILCLAQCYINLKLKDSLNNRSSDKNTNSETLNQEGNSKSGNNKQLASDDKLYSIEGDSVKMNLNKFKDNEKQLLEK